MKKRFGSSSDELCAAEKGRRRPSLWLEKLKKKNRDYLAPVQEVHEGHEQ